MRHSRRWISATFLVFALFALPARAPAFSRLFFCFFDAGSDALNPRCEQILAEFLDFWTRSRDSRLPPWPPAPYGPSLTLRVDIDGHVDAAEASRGLESVGERRARAMAEWLIAAGIPRAFVTVNGHGARQLLVPTAPNQAEPQNRRAQITSR